jgi:hypothetical protein
VRADQFILGGKRNVEKRKLILGFSGLIGVNSVLFAGFCGLGQE